MTLNLGDLAPDFELETGAGERLKLSDLRGRRVVLWFYPKDNTPGCTTEAIDFTAKQAEFEAAGVTLLGCSKDSAASHQRFAAKKELTVTLLSDPDHAVQDAYGMWSLKKNYGREYWGVIRSTFLIDAEGKLERIWPKVRVKGHVEEVLAAVRGEAT